MLADQSVLKKPWPVGMAWARLSGVSGGRPAVLASKRTAPVKASGLAAARHDSSQLTNSLLSLLGKGLAGALLGTSSVAQEFWVDAEEGGVSLSSGLLDAVSVGLSGLVVRRVVLRLCHPFSIYYADYIK